MCGNYVVVAVPFSLDQGSPPRVRELLFILLFNLLDNRITPACAGITLCNDRNTKSSRDHPRVCGNYRGLQADRGPGQGSPPRVRELPVLAYPDMPEIGITPACAGITESEGCKRLLKQDHPRVCGNYRNNLPGRSTRAGSPPRVRELLLQKRGEVALPRITPACAGITIE